MEGWERVHVKMIPMVAEGVLEDGLWVWDQGAIQGQFRIEVCCEQVDGRRPPGADDHLRYLREEGPLLT